MIKHTQGIFEAVKRPDIDVGIGHYDIIVRRAQNEINIASLSDGGYRNHLQLEANARLFAAAPDLLAACKAVIDLHRRDQLTDPKQFEQGWGKVFDAIHKATGENPLD